MSAMLLSRDDFAARSAPPSTAEPKLALLCWLLAVFLSPKCQDLHLLSQEHYRRALTWGSFISWKGSWAKQPLVFLQQQRGRSGCASPGSALDVTPEDSQLRQVSAAYCCRACMLLGAPGWAGAAAAGLRKEAVALPPSWERLTERGVF